MRDRLTASIVGFTKLRLAAALMFGFLVFPFASAFVVAPASVVSAATGGNMIQQALCSGSNLEFGDSGDCGDSGVSSDAINALLKKLVNIFSVIVGVIAVIMIIIGGLRYITSGGDSNNVSSAKNTLIYAIVGLVIVALAQLIVHWVLAQTQSIVIG